MATVSRDRKAARLSAAVLFAISWGSSEIVGAAEPWHVTPFVTIRGTATDNVDLAPNDQKRSAFLLEVLPGLRIDGGNGGRIKLHLNYQLDGVLAVGSGSNSQHDVRNILNANGTAELIDKFFFVDFTGNIAQNAASPFGPRPASDATFSQNRTESRTFQVSPYVKGRLAGFADYILRYSEIASRSGTSAGNSRVHELSGTLSSDASRQLAWAIEALSQRTDFTDLPDTRQDRIRGIAFVQVYPQFRVSGTAGAERNDFVSFDRATYRTYGVGAEWRPTQRTNLSGQWEHRFFGTGWNFAAAHRMPFLTFDISDTRDVTTDAQRLAGARSGVAYDLLYSALATRIPDPAQRALEAQRLLQKGGIPPDLNLPADFLTGGVFLNRSQQFSVALLGARNTAALSLYQTKRQQLGRELTPSEAFGADVLERAVALALSHRLTPLSSLTGSASWRRTTGTRSGGPETRQMDARILYTTRLGRSVTSTLELRHVRFAGESTSLIPDVRENAAVASVMVEF